MFELFKGIIFSISIILTIAWIGILAANPVVLILLFVFFPIIPLFPLALNAFIGD